MPNPEPTNPYAPPGAGSLPPRPRRWGIRGDSLARIGAVVAGFSLLADPGMIPLVGDAPSGRFLARVVGLVVLGVGFVPWRRNARPDRPPEHL